jgi:hypothetical protein
LQESLQRSSSEPPFQLFVSISRASALLTK